VCSMYIYGWCREGKVSGFNSRRESWEWRHMRLMYRDEHKDVEKRYLERCCHDAVA